MQIKTQYNFDLSSNHLYYVGKYEVLTGEDILPEKELLQKAATIKRFEYLPLGGEFAN